MLEVGFGQRSHVTRDAKKYDGLKGEFRTFFFISTVATSWSGDGGKKPILCLRETRSLT